MSRLLSRALEEHYWSLQFELWRSNMIYRNNLRDQGWFILVRGETAHIVDAARDPVVAVLVTPAPVAGEVEALHGLLQHVGVPTLAHSCLRIHGTHCVKDAQGTVWHRAAGNRQ